MYEIKLKIHEETDLYNSLDPDQMLLSDDVVSYILRKYEVKSFQGYYYSKPIMLEQVMKWGS